MTCLSEFLNFACILKGEKVHLEKIKEHILTEYVETGLVELINPTYDKKELHFLNESEWKKYQKLKTRDERLIGAGFP